jgi:hypothetical protein
MSNKGGRCLFASCNSAFKNDSGIKFFRIPINKNIKLARTWFVRSKRADIKFKDVKSSHRVCSLHFDPDDILPYIHGGRTQYRLKDDAVPYPNGKLLSPKKKRPFIRNVSLEVTFCCQCCF